MLRLSDAAPSIETAQDYLKRIDQMQQHLKDMRLKDARVREIGAAEIRPHDPGEIEPRALQVRTEEFGADQLGTEEVGARKAACKNAPDFALGSPSQAVLAAYPPTALPPEPVQDLLPKAKYVLEASVARVLYQGDKPDRGGRKKLAGPIPPERCQVVQLDVTRMIAGPACGSLIDSRRSPAWSTPVSLTSSGTVATATVVGTPCCTSPP